GGDAKTQRPAVVDEVTAVEVPLSVQIPAASRNSAYHTSWPRLRSYSENVFIRVSGGVYTCSVTRSASSACKFDTWWMSASSLPITLPSTMSRENDALT